MPQVGFRWGDAKLSFQEARDGYAAGTFPYPTPLIDAAVNHRDNVIPTASSLAGCLRRFALQREVDYYETPASSLPAIFGTAFHAEMERFTHTAPDQGIHQELQLTGAIDTGLTGEYSNVEVSGRVDYLHEGVLIRDWKTKVYIAKDFQPAKEHLAQVNVYNWLAAAAGYKPAVAYELLYLSQTWLSRFTGELQPVSFTGEWIAKRLRTWATAVSSGTLPKPLPQLSQVDAKGLPLAPCRYCPVREACMARLRDTQESPFADIPLLSAVPQGVAGTP